MGEPKEKGGCTSPCCAPTPAPAALPLPDQDDCCGSGSCAAGRTPGAAKGDDCFKPSVPIDEDKRPGTSDPADDCCKPAKPTTVSGCQVGCCAPKEKDVEDDDSCCGSVTLTEGPSASDGCCVSKGKGIVKDNCCGTDEPLIDESCQDSCCDTEEMTKDSCCGLEDPIAQDTCKRSCCSATKPQPKTAKSSCCEDKQGSCCSAKEAIDESYCGASPDLPEDTCRDECCSTTESETVEPSCCEGKQKPCCDATCIDRLMSREAANETEQGDNATGSGQGSAYRKKSTREMYETRLAALGCLCRALISLGQESCCATSDVSSVERKRGPKKALRSRSREKQVNSCKSKAAGGCCSKSPERRRSSSDSRPTKFCSKGCCKKPKEKLNLMPAKEAGCCSVDPACKRSCCEQEKDIAIEHLPKNDVEIANLEKGLSGSERVVLSISGMTCTGCETKLQQTLGRVAAVTNLKTSLVMARVDLQLDLSLASPEYIIKYIERTTEFKCDRIATHGTTLELITAGGAKQFAQKPMPLGVENVDVINEQIVRITFDPEVVGARDLVDKGFQTPVSLAPLQPDPALAAGSKHVRHMGQMTLASILLTIPVLVLAWAPLEARPVTYGSISLALATLVQGVIAGPFYPKALKSLIFSRVVEMDLLIVLSTTAAYTFSVVSFAYVVRGQPLSTGDFFETSTLLVTLIMVGRWVSALARQKAVKSISIRTLQASTAILISPDGTETEIDTRLLQYGDVFKVVPHTQVPTDGVVLSGTTEVDESMLTGESRPVEKKLGSTIIAGSLNGSGMVTARLTKLPGENTISIIAGMVDDAKLSKPKIQDLADRVASYFVPAVISLTIIVFIIWVAVGIRNQGKSGSEAVTQAVTYGITVLIVSCPCAIGLAVPMVIVIACGVAAEKGVIFKASEAVEVAHKTSHVVFDKTGTLTEGKLSVTAEDYPSEPHQVVTPKILGLLADVKHPVSSAVTAHLKGQGVVAAKVEEVKSIPGSGVQGYVDDLLIQAGNSRWLGLETNPLVQDVLARGHTAFCVTIGSELQAVFGLADTIRPDAASTIAELQKRNITVSMLSGDDDGAVQAVASTLGIPKQSAKSRCSPADKRAYIQQLLDTQTQTQTGADIKKNKEKQPVVVFVGDGTNDAVALAQATIGVHMHVNAGTDVSVAQSAADVVLLRPSLAGVLAMLDVSRAAVRRVAFNFAWSAVYNVFAVLLAAGAFVAAGRGAAAGVRIPPEFAGLGEIVSVLPVVVVAVSLRWAGV
ncbi:heavy metal translocatin [Hypoxylon sp. NC1633]|nr:heavy metal translocatin [Hypoxylon sp. NC1633]